MSGNHLDTVWTPEVMKFFLVLSKAPENFSYLEIARRLSKRFGHQFTKNACIGKGRRMGLPPREPQPSVSRPVKPKVRIPDPAGIPIEELERGDCKFIYGKLEDRPPFMYCGKPVLQQGGSWCRVHYGRVFNRRQG
jgi:GcrA cell cycle regulator